MKRIGAIIVARLDSTRLPGKCLLKVHEKSILQYVLERVRYVNGIDLVVLATSTREVDNPLEIFARHHGIGVFRGSAHDVAGRVLACARHFGFDAFFRVNGDSPLLDYCLYTYALKEFQIGRHDIVTNVLKRSFPAGHSVEIMGTDILAKGYQNMVTPDHFEHVTQYFYENADDFSLYNIVADNDEDLHIHLAIDSLGDLKCFEWMVSRMENNHLAYQGPDLIDLYYKYQKYFHETSAEVSRT